MQAYFMPKFRSRVQRLTLNKSAAIGRLITKQELATESGVPLSTLSRLYKPDYKFDRLDAGTLKGLMDYFDCKFEDLIEMVDD